MKSIIMSYMIDEAGKSERIADKIYKTLSNHPDILSEFIKWIKTRKYETENAICVQGYTAKMLSEIIDYGSADIYGYLAFLRDDPDYAVRELKDGLKIR